MALRPDVTGMVTDPLGRKIVSLSGIEAKRSASGKHDGPDAMTVSEAMTLVESPQFITESSSIANRNVYYRHHPEPSKPAYLRATVSFTEGESEYYDGVLISFSRYSKPVSGGVIWREEDDHGDA